MKRPKLHLRAGVLRVPLSVAASLAGGFLLSAGTVGGVASPLAAAFAGIVPPLYSMCILTGALLCYGAMGAPAGMHFLLIFLVLVTCLRVLFREQCAAHVQAFMVAFSGILGGFVLDFVFYAGSGDLPLYLFEAVLTGTAAYFLSDGAACLRENRRIVLHAGRTFTFALCYLLCITALCGLDTAYCNLGRVLGMTVTMLIAKQMRHSGGTLLGALTACGVSLCSVELGTPLLFLPVTAMMAGFLADLPNPLFVPVFFVLQGLSSAVLDSSRGLIKAGTELAVSCGVYALFCQLDLHRFLSAGSEGISEPKLRPERFFAQAFHALREETAAVMHRLTIAPPEDAVRQVREHLCTGCKNQSYCWGERGDKTSEAVRSVLHTGNTGKVPEPLDGCIRRVKLPEVCNAQATRNALSQMQRVHMLQSRQITLEHLQILEEVTSEIAARKSPCCLAPQTEALGRILHQCACKASGYQVCRLKTGRFTAEIISKQAEFPVPSVCTLMGQYLSVPLEAVTMELEDGSLRICLYERPPYRLEIAMHSENAPDYERCGDHSDAFTDAAGDQYLVLSDGMGSGSTASLASRIAVRTFRRMVQSGMQVPTAIRLVNSMLMTETSTENFATLDVLHFHADCGELSLYKSGAAATLFCHRGQVQRISSMSFPVGIVTDALPSRKHTTAYEGDMIVMLSDGIGEAEYPYISQLLREEMPPAALTQTVCSKSGIFHGGQSRDDVTVIAARVLSHFRTDFTKKREHTTEGCVENAPELSKSL